jgi:hypothetical protein
MSGKAECPVETMTMRYISYENRVSFHAFQELIRDPRIRQLQEGSKGTMST